MPPRSVSEKLATSLSSSASTSTLSTSSAHKSRARTNRSRPAPTNIPISTSTPSSAQASTLVTPSGSTEDFATKAFQTDAAKQRLVHALEVHDVHQLFGQINTTIVFTDETGRRRYHQVSSDALATLGIFGGNRGDDSGLRVVLSTADEEDKGGGAKVEEIDDVDEVEEVVTTPPEGEVEGESMALVKRDRGMVLEMPPTPRPRSIARFEDLQMVDDEVGLQDAGMDEEEKREKKRQKRIRSKLRKREGRKLDQVAPLSDLRQIEEDGAELQDGIVQPDQGLNVPAEAREEKVEIGKELLGEMAGGEGVTEVEWMPKDISGSSTEERQIEVTVNDYPIESRGASPDQDDPAEEDKENIPVPIALPQLPPPLPKRSISDDWESHPLPGPLQTSPNITITQDPLHPAVQPQYREISSNLTPVVEEEDYDVLVPDHEAKGPQDASEAVGGIIVSLPPTTQPRRPLQPPLFSSTSSPLDLTFEAVDEHDIPHPHHSTHRRPVPHVSPTHIDLLPLMIPCEDFDATFLSILPSTPPLETQDRQSKPTLEVQSTQSPRSEDETETSEQTPRMTALEVEIGSPPQMDLETTSEEDKSGESITIGATVEPDTNLGTPELKALDLAVIWEGEESAVVAPAIEDDDDELLVFPSPEPTPTQVPPPPSLPIRPSSAVAEHPLSSSWTLFYSSTSSGGATSIPTHQSRLKPKGAAEYSHGLFHLFSYSNLHDLFGAWKALRRRIARKHQRPIEEQGMLLMLGHEGLGVAFMPDDTNFHFFRTGIKPMWEDEMCAKGGKVMLTGSPAKLDLAFYKLVILLAGGVVDHEIPTTEGCMVVGAVLSKRDRNSRVEIWLGGKEAPPAPWIKAVEQFVYAEFPGEKGYPYRPFKAK